MPLDRAMAEDALRRVAEPLGISITEAALGLLQVQKFGMTQSIELNSVRRGYDPRDFTLVAAGGDMERVGFIGNAAGAMKVGIIGHRSSIEKVPLVEFLTTLLK